MEIISNEVGVSWGHSLHINDVVALVWSLNALDFDWTSNWNCIACQRVNHIIYFDRKSLSDLKHLLVEFRVCSNRLLFIDCSILSHAWKLLVVKNAWDDALTKHTVTFVVDNAGGKMVQALDINSLKESQTGEVMVWLSKWRVVFFSSQISVWSRAINSIREEDLVVDINMRPQWFIWVQCLQLAINNCNRSLSRRLHEVIVSLGYIPINLEPLHEVFTSNGFKDLELFIPVPWVLGIKTVKWNKSLAHFIRSWNFDFLVVFECEPAIIHWGALGQEVWVSLQDWGQEDLKVWGKTCWELN